MTLLHKPILIVIAGPNGSGKTTITSRLLKSEWLEDAVYINPDNVAQEKFGDWNSPEAVVNAVKYCENGEEARPLFRLKKGQIGKIYTDKIPEWAKDILPLSNTDN